METLCRSCARPIERTGEGRVYCSRRCSSRRITPQDRRLEAALVELLGARDPGASICPSEVARAEAASWRPLLEHARRAGRRLASTGIVQFTQGGRVVDPGRARGPVRIRRGPAWGRAGR